MGNTNMVKSMTDIELWSEKFKKICMTRINREGIYELINWLDGTDFFTAPAGRKHHGAYPGGLVRHSLNVYAELRRETILTRAGETGEGARYQPEKAEEETIAICGLLHDVCKADFYRLNEAGSYYIDDRFPFGHGEKSVYLISRFIRLTDEEALAIRWHMGPYDEAAKGGSRELDEAMAISPLVYALHAADMRAAQEERRQEAADNEHKR